MKNRSTPEGIGWDLELGRIMKSSIVKLILSLAAVIAVCALPEAAFAALDGDSFGLSGPHTTVRTTGTDEPVAQGALPGQLLTPMFRLDLTQVLIESDEDADAPFNPPDDTVLELLAMRVIVEVGGGARLKDIAGLAIARDALGNYAGDVAQSSVNYENGTSALAPEDQLTERVGDLNDPVGNRFGIYTPSEDPIIAYIPMAALLQNPEFGVNPLGTSLDLTINLSPDTDMISIIVGDVMGPNQDYTERDEIDPSDILLLNSPHIVRGAFERVNSIFYFLLSPSGSAPNGSTFSAELDVLPGVFPDAECFLCTAGGTDLENLPTITELSSPLDLPLVRPTRFVTYDYGNGGLVLRVPFPACQAVDPPAEEDDDDDDDDEEEPPQLCDINPDDYLNIENLPVLPRTLRGSFQIQSLFADQVPYRKVNGVFDDGDIITGGLDQFNLGSNDVFSQFPPNYPRLEWEREATDNPIDMASPFIVGRFHPDSGIPQQTYPSPEVMAAGEQTYALFGMDFAGGWVGGYGFRIASGGSIIFDVQGLGELHEIPRDGIDNDGDGLTDEWTVEDAPSDRQLAGRNDDFDFFYDLREPNVDGPNAVSGGPLSATEIELAEAISNKFVVNVEQIGNQLGYVIGDFILEGAFNPGWDPVFPVEHLWDENAGLAASDPNSFSLPSKYYRDLVATGFAPDFGFFPQLGIRLERMKAQNPERAAYMVSLMRIGALQSRGVDEDGDGEANSPVVNGLKIADGIDNDVNGLIDEGIDEESVNELDDDGDGLIDEDVNFVPALLAIDEEIVNFFVDAPGGRFGAYDEGVDFLYHDFNHNGSYDDGRNDSITPNRDEFIGPGVSPLVQGDPYYAPFVYPIDDDLDAEGEDGNPLTPPPATYDGLDNDNDGFVDNGFNEDVKDQVFGDPRLFRISFPKNGFIANSALWRDFNLNSRLDPGLRGFSGAGGDDYPGLQNASVPSHQVVIQGDPDHYFFVGNVFPQASGRGPSIPVHSDGKYNHFYGIHLPSNMPIGLDFQISVLPGSINFTFDNRPNFNPSTISYPNVNFSEAYTDRFPGLGQIAGSSLSRPAASTVYEITKRQFAHLEMADAMGYKSPLERAGGFRGLPYLDTGSDPTPVVAINMADAVGFTQSALGLTDDPGGGISQSFAVLNSIRVNFDPVQLEGGLFNPTGNAGDLRPLSDQIFTDPDTNRQFADSGVSLYLDNKTAGEIGAFDPLDIPVQLNLETLVWNEDPTDPVVRAGGHYVVLRPVEGISMPNTDFYEPPNQPIFTHDVNRGYDLFVCVRTSPQAGARNTFRAFIRPGDISFVNGFNTNGTMLTTTTYTINPPTVLTHVPEDDLDIIPLSDSTPMIGINLYDSNATFGDTPARLSTVSLSIDNVGNDLQFTPSDLRPLTGAIVRNIPLDPGEDNDNNPETFPIPDGLDNDDDGLVDEGLNNSLIFDPNRYTTLSGVALFRDMPQSDTNGGFDDPLDPDVINPDLPVFLSGSEQFAFPVGIEAHVTLALDHDPLDNPGPGSPGKGDPYDPEPFETLPVNDNGLNFGPDYFVVIRTSKTISQGDDFQVRFETTFQNVDSQFFTQEELLDTPFGFMPGFTQGTGPVFPFRQPYRFDPLINATLGGGGTTQQPTSPGFLDIPGFGTVQIDNPFDFYEGYYDLTSVTVTNIEDGSDAPTLSFLFPAFGQTTSFDESILPGSIFLRWNDIDEDNPESRVTLVYFPIVIDQFLGEIIPISPNDFRFDFRPVFGVPRSFNLREELDDFDIVGYENELLSDDNENVNPVTGLGNDIFTWDARRVPDGIYRIGAILDDGQNPVGMAVSGKIVIENSRPILELTQP